MDDLKDLQVAARKLRGNEVLALEDPAAVWRLQTGSVALFSVVLRDGVATAPRRYLFSVGPGEALFGFPAVTDAARPRVVAVALEDSLLRKLAACEPAGDRSQAGTPELSSWMDRWEACLGALEARALEPEDPGAFQRAVLDRLEEIERNQRQQEVSRLREAERRFHDAARDAVSELTSVLRPGSHVSVEGSDLFVAAQAVAQAQRIVLRPPAAWEASAATGDEVELIARASHVRVRQIVLHDGWWRQDCGPLLGRLAEERRTVALLPASPGRYEMLDAATRSRVAIDQTLAARLEPHAHVFYRPLPERATQGLELIRFALAGRSRDIAAIAATAIAATLLGMVAPQATALLVDQAIPGADRTLLWPIGLALLAAAFGSAIFRFSQGLAMLRLETSADAATQSAVWDRLLNLQLSFFRRFSTGDLQSRVTAITQIRSYLGGTTLRTLFSSVMLLLNLALLLYYSPMLTLVAAVVAALSCSVALISGTMVLRCTRQALELKGKFFGLMVQLVTGVTKLRVAAAEERAFARWARDYARLLRLEFRQRRIQDTVHLLNIAISVLSTIALFGIAAPLIRQEGAPALSTGQFLAFSVAYGTFIGAIVSLSNTVTDVLSIAILRERARPILEAVPEVNERKSEPGRLEGRLELEHLVFHYKDDGPMILDDVSMKVEPGRFVALVGPSGSGKSTLFRLLLGFETPQSGSIYYDGQDLAGLDVHAVRRQMGVVLQNGRINAGSLFENIVTGTRLSLEDTWEAARATGFADEIAAMPMGMHTIISEGGTNLSGGQRQRLLLTRALVHRPRILLLDEATSALDNKTQSLVSESLRRLRVTRIVIAHRLSTVRDAERIHVLDAGRIVQEGSFDELASQEGIFARLIARQLA